MAYHYILHTQSARLNVFVVRFKRTSYKHRYSTMVWNIWATDMVDSVCAHTMQIITMLHLQGYVYASTTLTHLPQSMLRWIFDEHGPREMQFPSPTSHKLWEALVSCSQPVFCHCRSCFTLSVIVKCEWRRQKTSLAS